MPISDRDHDLFAPCPFCGSDDIHHESQRGVRWARCQNCSATGGYIMDFEEDAPFTRETVLARWNIRTAPEKKLSEGTCPYCKGTGKEKANDILVRCRFCSGTGRVQ